MHSVSYKEKPAKLHRLLSDSIRRYFLAGVATVFPLFITVYIIVIIFRFFDRLAGRYINSFLLEQYGFVIPGLGFVITLASVVIIGLISTHFIGRKVVPFFENLFLKIPFVASIYPSAKQLSQFLFQEEKQKRFKKVVLIQYPYEGSHSIGFITNEHIPEFDKKADSALVNVFVPLAPAPFSGVILLVPRNKIKVLDISIDKAIKFIVSGGVVAPSQK
jgi:uncharacterized membrane protein